jgi:hypothetical protein
MILRSLTDIANSHATDKGTQGPSDRWGAHNYTDIYEAYLERRRLEPITMLEIGLGVTGDRWTALIVHGRNTGGASMKMWYDYFPRASIYGLDVNACPHLNNDRIHTFIADQGNVNDLEAFARASGGVEFDLIIDDGSHRPDHQQVSLGYFFKRLKPGGLYFIEDLLPNGLGSGDSSRLACNAVRDTRSLLRHFLEHREFPEPNAILDPSYLQEHIDYLNFHVPDYSVDLVWKRNWRRPFSFAKTVRFRPGAEKLCVIRKK